MKKEIRQVSEDGKTLQITFMDERWYARMMSDDKWKYVPSSSWISKYVPMGIGFYKYLAQMGWDEAEAIKREKGNKGTKVHQAVSELLLGNNITVESKLRNSDTGEPESITIEEWEAIMSFVDWHKEFKPETIVNEMTVFNDEHNYAGTLDYLCKIGDEVHLVDFKTSQDVYTSHTVQLASYKYALPPDMPKPDKLAILQLGYRRNKKKWKYNEIPDQFQLFLSAKNFWAEENSKLEVPKREYPTTLSLNLNGSHL